MIKKPKYKTGRRLGAGVYEKCQTTKFSTSRGGTSLNKRKSVTEYGLQLIEKQKVRFSYGITERQLSNYVKEATKVKGSGTSEKFYEILESRLDNVVYRMGVAPTRRASRQMVAHGHFMVNGKRVTIPSLRVKQGDLIETREGSKSKKIFGEIPEKLKNYSFPNWVNFDASKLQGRVLGTPKGADSFIDLNAVLEFYSR